MACVFGMLSGIVDEAAISKKLYLTFWNCVL